MDNTLRPSSFRNKPLAPHANLLYEALGSSTQRLNVPRNKQEKIGHRRVDELGQVSYKNTPTRELMASVQLGLNTSLAYAEKVGQRDLLVRDFELVEILDFPSQGGGQPPTPAHSFTDFTLDSYAPDAFCHFRRAFKIEPRDFMSSLCGDSLRELSNPGASGSIFYLSADDNFIIKTVQSNEADFLLKLLAQYYMNLTQNPHTLLPKFYGLYTYHSRGKNIRFMVMNNLLPSNVTIHEKYDLKGSTFKRKASTKERDKKVPTLKDLDFMAENPDGILLDAEKYEALKKTIERDCRVLESFKIMDYSLLLGIHNHTIACQQAAATTPTSPVIPFDPPDPQQDPVGSAIAALVRNIAGLSSYHSTPAFHTAMEAIQGDGLVLSTNTTNPSTPVASLSESDPNSRELGERYQSLIVCDHRGGIPAKNAKGDKLYLYVGIIDILQNYRLEKKLEHAFKAMIYDGDAISVCRPKFYSSRFKDFIFNNVFKKGPSSLRPHLKLGQPPRQRFGGLTSRPDLLPPIADVNFAPRPSATIVNKTLSSTAQMAPLSTTLETEASSDNISSNLESVSPYDNVPPTLTTSFRNKLDYFKRLTGESEKS